jgi:hypothetical protein
MNHRIKKNWMTAFLIILTLIYFIYTLNYAIKFNKNSHSFTEKQMVLHNILIWLIPFFWIMIVKTAAQPRLGSHHFKKTKSAGQFYESGLGFWDSGDTHSHHGNEHCDTGGSDGAGVGDDWLAKCVRKPLTPIPLRLRASAVKHRQPNPYQTNLPFFRPSSPQTVIQSIGLHHKIFVGWIEVVIFSD